MKHLFKIGFMAFIAFAMTGCQAQAQQEKPTQKIAFVDAESIIPNMPEYKQADSDMRAYQEILQKQFQDEQTKLEQYYSSVMQRAQAGALTPNQEKMEQEKLMKMQQDLQQKTAQMEEDVMAKRAELEKPVYEKFNNALKEIAKANNYNYILSKNAFLYSEGGEDATAKVKSQLGLQ